MLSKLQLIMDGQTQHAAARTDPCLPKLQIICASNLDVNQLIYGWDNKGSSLNDQPTSRRVILCKCARRYKFSDVALNICYLIYQIMGTGLHEKNSSIVDISFFFN